MSAVKGRAQFRDSGITLFRRKTRRTPFLCDKKQGAKPAPDHLPIQQRASKESECCTVTPRREGREGMWRTQEGIRRYRKTIKAQTIKMRGRGSAGYRVCLSRRRPQIRASSLPPVRMRVWIALRSEVQGEHAEQLRCSMTNKRPKSRLAKTGSSYYPGRYVEILRR
jgi:hypothetical protein